MAAGGAAVVDPGGHANPAAQSLHSDVPGGPYLPAGHEDAATTAETSGYTNHFTHLHYTQDVRRPNLVTKTVKFDALVNAPLLLSVTVSDTFTPRRPAS
jgi:hypothetical protein